MAAKGNGWTLREWIDGSKASHYFDSYKVYILECFNDQERFVKIGRSFTSIQRRYFDHQSMPYSYTVLMEIKDENPYRIFMLENKLKRKFKAFKYKPLIAFKGMHECFDVSIKPLISEQPNVNT